MQWARSYRWATCFLVNKAHFREIDSESEWLAPGAADKADWALARFIPSSSSGIVQQDRVANQALHIVQEDELQSIVLSFLARRSARHILTFFSRKGLMI